MSGPAQSAPPSTGQPRRGASRGWLRRIVLAGSILLVLAVGAGTALYALTPPVSNALARVRALAREHGAAPADGLVPRSFAEAIVASEDARFYVEPGIDPIGIARAAWLAVSGSGVDGGGSTISQQLAKVLYTGGRGGPGREIEQVGLALKLNLVYSKAQILRMYADSVYFGNGFYGLSSASCGYFGVRPGTLSLAQASLLAGLVQAPSAYDPLTHLASARARQHYVVGRLLANGTISSAVARRTLRAPLALDTSAASRRVHSCSS